MKRVTRMMSILVVLLLMLSLFSACSLGKSHDLTFDNQLSTEMHQICISSTDSSTWGDAVNSSKIAAGRSFSFDFSDFDGSSGSLYDIGTIDENSDNYDVYEVTLTEGDTIALSGSADSATFTVTHADGTSDSYDAITYNTGD